MAVSLCRTSTSSGLTPIFSATIMAPRRLVALPVRRGAGDDLDLVGGQDAHRGRLPPAGRVVQRGEHPRRSEAAHLEVGADTHADELGRAGDVLGALPGAERPRSRPTPTPSWLRRRDRRSRTTSPLNAVYGNCSLRMKLRRRNSTGIDPDLGGEGVHRAFDGVRGLGPAGAAIGVGRGHRGEHAGAREVVGRGMS